jgi:hypothetical protein
MLFPLRIVRSTFASLRKDDRSGARKQYPNALWTAYGFGRDSRADWTADFRKHISYHLPFWATGESPENTDLPIGVIIEPQVFSYWLKLHVRVCLLILRVYAADGQGRTLDLSFDLVFSKTICLC